VPIDIKRAVIALILSCISTLVGVYFDGLELEEIGYKNPVILGINFVWMIVIAWLVWDVTKKRSDIRLTIILVGIIMAGSLISNRIQYGFNTAQFFYAIELVMFSIALYLFNTDSSKSWYIQQKREKLTMENLNNWKLIKIGFWLGIGFVVPVLLLMGTGTALGIYAFSTFEDTIEYDTDEFAESIPGSQNLSENIKIKSYKDASDNNKLLLLGTIVNEGEVNVSSIQLEAELIDDKGDFVYECSAYISRTLEPKESENFQIKCGCKDGDIPKYSNINIRVVNASNF
jgi:hypothetical protein